VDLSRLRFLIEYGSFLDGISFFGFSLGGSGPLGRICFGFLSLISVVFYCSGHVILVFLSVSVGEVVGLSFDYGLFGEIGSAYIVPVLVCFLLVYYWASPIWCFFFLYGSVVAGLSDVLRCSNCSLVWCSCWLVVFVFLNV